MTGYSQPSAESGLKVHSADGVLQVLLDRPESRNAQTPAMWRELASIGQGLPSGTRAVIVRASGPSFSAGLDRRMLLPDGIPGERSLMGMVGLAADELDRLIAGYQGAFRWLRECEAITVAAVQGHAVGAGFQLALACDLMVVADDARLAMRETSLGLVPDLAGTRPLVERVGVSRALEICASGRWVDAHEAVRTGIAVAHATADDLDEVVAGLLAPILAAPADAVAALKGLLHGASSRSYDDQCAAERRAQRLRLEALARMVGG